MPTPESANGRHREGLQPQVSLVGVHDLVERDGCWALNGVLSGVEDHPNQVAERVLEQQMVIESKSSDPEEAL